MKQWGLAVISMGGVFILTSQLQENSFYLIVVGLSLVVAGIIMYRKGKSDKESK